MALVYLGLGSNLGNKKAYVSKAITFIKESCKVLNISSWYSTEPVGYTNQDYFLNAVLKIETNFSPEALLIFLQTIEKKLGKNIFIKDGPRTIDIDILFYDNFILHKKNLTIPHPKLHARKFVLIPLSEIDPFFVHPIFNKSVKTMLKELQDDKEVRKV